FVCSTVSAFCFTAPPTPEISPLSLHDALPIYAERDPVRRRQGLPRRACPIRRRAVRRLSPRLLLARPGRAAPVRRPAARGRLPVEPRHLPLRRARAAHHAR